MISSMPSTMKWLPFVRRRMIDAGDADGRRTAAADGDIGNPMLSWQPGTALIADRNRTVTVNKIKRLVGLPDEIFDPLYRQAIEAVAEFVQLLPATEKHHRARPGGLLDHALDVSERALCLRRGRLLPPGQPPEVVARRGDRWTYGVFLAALLHDLGNLVTTLRVSRFDQDGQGLGFWSPMIGPMKSGDRYRVALAPEQNGHDPSGFVAFVARSLVPPKGLHWLSEDRELITRWLASLGSERRGSDIIGDLVHEADQQSITADTGEMQDTQRHPKNTDLAEDCRAALRRLFGNSERPINEPGADAWVTTTDLWVTSKSGLRRLREELVGNSVVSVQGTDGGIMDALQARKICTPNPKGRAVWSVTITVDDVEQHLTMLRFPATEIWPDPTTRPEPYTGEVTPERTAAASVGADDEEKRPSKLRWKNVTAAFFRWIEDGIRKGRLSVNDRNGGLWMVKEGLFLRSPGVYKAFADEAGYDYTDVQKAVQSQVSLLMNTKSKPTPMIHYREVTTGKKDLAMKGHVVTDPKAILSISLPVVSTRLVREAGPDGNL